MKATWNGATIAESDDTVVVDGNHYGPEASLTREYLTFSNPRASCPWKGQAHYYRIHGPTILIEYDNQQTNANHIHTVWRDLRHDFGGDLLAEHDRKHKHANSSR